MLDIDCYGDGRVNNCIDELIINYSEPITIVLLTKQMFEINAQDFTIQTQLLVNLLTKSNGKTIKLA